MLVSFAIEAGRVFAIDVREEQSLEGLEEDVSRGFSHTMLARLTCSWRTRVMRRIIACSESCSTASSATTRDAIDSKAASTYVIECIVAGCRMLMLKIRAILRNVEGW